MSYKINGIFPASITPFKNNGEFNRDGVQPLVNKFISDGVDGLFILGTNGEGNLMTISERKEATEAFLNAAKQQIPIVVHVGHANPKDSYDLADHAKISGASALSFLPPYYHKPDSVETTVRWLEEITSQCGEIPIIYYHIPDMTGVRIPPSAILTEAKDRIPTLSGIKFSENNVLEVAKCNAINGGNRYQIMWGVDETLLSGRVSGATGAIGSSYNYATKIYQPIIDYLNGFQNSTLKAAQSAQEKSRKILQIINSQGGLPIIKYLMKYLGLDCGPPRTPFVQVTEPQWEKTKQELEILGFFEWIKK